MSKSHCLYLSKTLIKVTKSVGEVKIAKRHLLRLWCNLAINANRNRNWKRFFFAGKKCAIEQCPRFSHIKWFCSFSVSSLPHKFGKIIAAFFLHFANTTVLYIYKSVLTFHLLYTTTYSSIFSLLWNHIPIIQISEYLLLSSFKNLSNTTISSPFLLEIIDLVINCFFCFTDLKMATSYQIGFMKDGKISSQIVAKTKSCKYKNFDYILSNTLTFWREKLFFRGFVSWGKKE